MATEASEPPRPHGPVPSETILRPCDLSLPQYWRYPSSVLFNVRISGNEKDVNAANTALRRAGIEAQEEFSDLEGARETGETTRTSHILLYAEIAGEAEARIRDLLPSGDYRVEAQPSVQST
jgi:hypothetical protein